jgi:hypothetical protein
LTVTLRNSNDRPTVPPNQIRSIEEWSAQELLVQSAVEAEDNDEGQGFIFTLIDTKRGDAVRTEGGIADATDLAQNAIVSGDNQPFVVGRCSGIIKVKNDVLRYDYDPNLAAGS